jgi:hypothetical protein
MWLDAHRTLYAHGTLDDRDIKQVVQEEDDLGHGEYAGGYSSEIIERSRIGPPPLPCSVDAAVRYLNAKGARISRGPLYNWIKGGKVRPVSDEGQTKLT